VVALAKSRAQGRSAACGAGTDEVDPGFVHHVARRSNSRVSTSSAVITRLSCPGNPGEHSMTNRLCNGPDRIAGKDMRRAQIDRLRTHRADSNGGDLSGMGQVCELRYGRLSGLRHDTIRVCPPDRDILGRGTVGRRLPAA